MKTTNLINANTPIHQLNSNEEFIFVYGTLLKGKCNYNRFLAPAEPEMRGEIEGFEMYDLGAFPAIVKGEGRVKGEVYRVNPEQLARIDRLEGEGTLYIKEKVKVVGYCFHEEVDAYVYIYNHKVDGLNPIPYASQPYKNEYIWYVSYGSNMCFKRFSSYIVGGYCERNGKDYDSCADDTLPTESAVVRILGDMYFANFNKGSWKNSAVSFFNKSGFNIAIGRAYLIKKSQLAHIHKWEGCGPDWYPDLVELDDIMGIKAVTFTNNNVKRYAPMSEISMAYISNIIDGFVEMGFSEAEAFEYVKQCTSKYLDCCWTKEDADYAYAEEKKGA